MSIIRHSAYSRDDIIKAIKVTNSKIYFIGIGGISMSSLAELMLLAGCRVYGSNIEKSDAAVRLESLGVDISYTHKSGRISAIMPTLVVYSLAIGMDNPEYSEAKRLGIVTVSRAELLGVIMMSYTHRIGISGSHGKSTGTALLTKMASAGSKEPTAMVGAPAFDGASLLFGREEYFIYEACEYGDSFLCFSPSISVILNLELDHTDYFDSMDSIKHSFSLAASRAARAVLNFDDPEVRSLEPMISSDIVSVASKYPADYTYKILDIGSGRYTLEMYKSCDLIAELKPRLRGSFNMPTVAAATVAALECGIDIKSIESAVSGFSGIPRRLEYRGRHLFADVFYDYAHHPTEIKATRSALEKMGYKNICAIFAPHTYTRTEYFFDSFATELSRFSSALITDIYGARESAIAGVSSDALSAAVRAHGTVSYTLIPQNTTDIIRSLSPDCIVMMGAGDLSDIKKRIEEN